MWKNITKLLALENEEIKYWTRMNGKRYIDVKATKCCKVMIIRKIKRLNK